MSGWHSLRHPQFLYRLSSLEDSHLKLHRIKPKWKNITRAAVSGFVKDLHCWTALLRSQVDGMLFGWMDCCWGDHLWSFRKGRLSCSTQGYTPLVEVNQAVIAWSFRQLLLVNLEQPALWSKLSTMIITLDNGARQKTNVGWPTLPLNLLSYFISRLSEVLKKASSEWSNADDYLRNQMELAELTVSV